MSAPKLRTISDDILVNRLHDLVRQEREMLLDVLHHLNEVERRDIHLKSGYRSMFAYCTGRLKYSESAAGRRIQSARAIRRYPRVAELVENGEINISTIAKVAGIALSRNDPTLFERIRDKTQDEAATIAAEYRPRARPRDRVRPVSVCVTAGITPGAAQVPLAAAASGSSGSPPVPDPRSRDHSRRGSTDAAMVATAAQKTAAGTTLMARVAQQAAADAAPNTEIEQSTPPTACAAGNRVLPTVDTMSAAHAGQQTNTDAAPAARAEPYYMVQFVAGTELMRAIDQVRSLLSFRLPADASMESVLAIVLDEFIERHSPDRRRERRKAKGAGRGNHKGPVESEQTARPRGETSQSVLPNRPQRGNPEPAPGPGSWRRESGTTSRPRHIPAGVRDEVLVRDGVRCSYVGHGETRCSATRHLQIDHIVPVARGGGSDVGNLRVLCGAHNRLEAKRLLGAAAMAPFMRRE